jgi:hypothetical protein
MLQLLISVVLGLIPLAGVAYIVFQGGVLTVDGLFTSLILLAMSGIFFLNAGLELWRQRSAQVAASKAAAVAAPQPVIKAGLPAGSTLTESGEVMDLSYFEAPVGQPNKSLVTFRPNGASSAHIVVFTGDVRNVLPRGKRVTITYTATPEGNTLVAVN